MSDAEDKKDLPQKIETVIEKLPKDTPNDVRLEIIQIMMKSTESYSGPIPPAAQLREMNEIVPDGANRLVKIYENQVAHRHEMEKQEQRLTHGNIRRGQYFAVGIAVSVISMCSMAIFLGRSVEGIVGIIALLVAITSAFIYDKSKK